MLPFAITNRADGQPTRSISYPRVKHRVAAASGRTRRSLCATRDNCAELELVQIDRRERSCIACTARVTPTLQSHPCHPTRKLAVLPWKLIDTTEVPEGGVPLRM